MFMLIDGVTAFVIPVARVSSFERERCGDVSILHVVATVAMSEGCYQTRRV